LGVGSPGSPRLQPWEQSQGIGFGGYDDICETGRCELQRNGPRSHRIRGHSVIRVLTLGRGRCMMIVLGLQEPGPRYRSIYRSSYCPPYRRGGPSRLAGHPIGRIPPWIGPLDHISPRGPVPFLSPLVGPHTLGGCGRGPSPRSMESPISLAGSGVPPEPAHPCVGARQGARSWEIRVMAGARMDERMLKWMSGIDSSIYVANRFAMRIDL